MSDGRTKRALIIGGGTGGRAFAGHLVRLSGAEATLLEARPDYSPFDEFRWPTELLGTRCMPETSHDWGLRNEDTARSRTYPLERAKVIGGCSSHNGCSAVRGTRRDLCRLGEGHSGRLGAGWPGVRLRTNRGTYGIEEITPLSAAGTFGCGELWPACFLRYQQPP
jgi:choline dehydrogenase